MSTRVLQELVEYYQCHSLKESFKQLDTTLKYPYKSRERAATRASSRSPGNARPRPAHRRSPRGVCSARSHGPALTARLPSRKALLWDPSQAGAPAPSQAQPLSQGVLWPL